MENIDFWSLLTPWIELVVILVPLIYTERWVHQHFFGIGYILSKKNAVAATRLFYVFFSPGIFVHEVVQYLIAGALSVPIKRLIAWPEKQENGTLRLDFIVVDRTKIDPVRAAIVAASPFILMSAIVWYLSTQRLRLDVVAAAIGTGDMPTIMDALSQLVGTADFFVFMYLLFVVANSMLPKKEDAHGFPVILGGIGVISLVLIVVGLDGVLIETLGGTVANTLNRISTALACVLGLNLCAIGLLSLIEAVAVHYTGIEMDYGTGKPVVSKQGDSKRIPGSDAPYPKGERVPSIYNLHLPLPTPTDRPAMKVRETTPARTGSSRSAAPAGDAPARPAFGASRPAETAPSRFGSLGSRSTGENKPVEDEAPARPSFGANRPGGTEPGTPRPALGSSRATGENKPVDGEAPARPGFGANRPAETAPSRFGSLGSSRSTGENKPVEDEAPARPSFGANRPGGAEPGAPRPAFGSRPTGEDKPVEGEAPARPSFGANRPAGAEPGAPRPAFGSRSSSEDKPVESEAPARPSFGANRSEPAVPRSPLSTGIRPPTRDDDDKSPGIRVRETTPQTPPADRPARPTGNLPALPNRPDATARPGFRPAPRVGGEAGNQEDDEPEDDLRYESFDEDEPPAGDDF